MTDTLAARTSAAARQVAWSALAGYQDYRALFTPVTWLLGWTLRLVCQVLFFAGLGRLVGSAATEAHVAIGNAVLLAPLGCLGVISSTVRERLSGTLQFLLISRAGVLLVLASRGLYWVLDAMITSTVALCLVPLLLGVPLHWAALPAVLPVVAVTSLGCYAMALCAASVSLRVPESRTYLSGGLTILLMLVSGASAAAPGWAVLSLLPVVHGLPVARALALGEPYAPTALAAELAVALLWGCLAWFLLSRALRRTVRTGALSVG